jgi:hypothetical protein
MHNAVEDSGCLYLKYGVNGIRFENAGNLKLSKLKTLRNDK